ncbi:ROK family protein [Anoxybacillus suryakundensis]|uniref:fructokinase n=1 Tax=Anoxybacillus suryakundensis TaxID=1325335 RepID=A0A0K6GQC2_9BACL|nr:ROK family protein [Anoxybacillus suryakundensis]CUA80817.1 Sugar kinase of the NBD/HSP70 family, may contain an N-terminal HTH domain [Anoxybacillus suryakundensis]
MYLGAIEAGGTKFVCAVGDSGGNIHERVQFPTTAPEETMQKVIDFFKSYSLDAIGIGTFGPVDLNRKSQTYGYITNTPKPHWTNFNFVGTIQKYFHVPIGFDTDVNAAALGELFWGRAKGKNSCIYMTVGTGIGVGAIVEGRLVHGLLHPEMGHIVVRRHPDDTFVGSCPFHGDCLEGLASGPAIEKRWGKRGADLSEQDEVWELEAFYLGQAIAQYILVLSPEQVIIGGGVAKQSTLLPRIHRHVLNHLNGYVQHEVILKHIDHYITLPGLGDNAGICGALALAKQALGDK